MSTIAYIDPKIYIAMRDHLLAMSGGYTIVQPGEDYPSNANAPFLLVQDVRLDPQKLYANDDATEALTGIFSVTLMAPLSWSHTQMLGVAGLVREHFLSAPKLYHGGATVTTTGAAYIATQAFRDGAYMRLPINIPWRCAG